MKTTSLNTITPAVPVQFFARLPGGSCLCIFIPIYESPEKTVKVLDTIYSLCEGYKNLHLFIPAYIQKKYFYAFVHGLTAWVNIKGRVYKEKIPRIIIHQPKMTGSKNDTHQFTRYMRSVLQNKNACEKAYNSVKQHILVDGTHYNDICITNTDIKFKIAYISGTEYDSISPGLSLRIYSKNALSLNVFNDAYYINKDNDQDEYILYYDENLDPCVGKRIPGGKKDND